MKRARKKERQARPQPPTTVPKAAKAAASQSESSDKPGKKREKRKEKRAAKRKLREEDAVPEPDEPEELEGVVVDGELLLRGADGTVYASERDVHGALVAVGRWEAGTVRPLPAAAPAPSRAQPRRARRRRLAP